MKRATLKKLMSVSVTEDMFELLKCLADSDNISVGEMVRSALDYALGHQYKWRKSDQKNLGKRNCVRFNPADFDETKLNSPDLKEEV